MKPRPMLARLQAFQPKLHGLAVGMTLGIGSVFLGQVCPQLGSCPTCAACAARLPLLALPLVADSLMVVATRMMKRREPRIPEHEDTQPSGCLPV